VRDGKPVSARAPRFFDPVVRWIRRAIEISGRFAHTSDLEAERSLIEGIGGKAAEENPQRDLQWRAALFTGLERFDDALRCQISLTRLAPRDPEPYLACARLHRQLARAARTRDDNANWGREMQRALSKLQVALRLAVFERNELVAVRVLIERARILLDMDQPDRALADIGLALAKDDSRAEALALKKAAERRVAEILDVRRRTEPRPVVAEADAPGLPLLPLGEAQQPAVLLERTKSELENAGKGLRSIYRGFKDILTTPGAKSAGATGKN
jgi:tetratricopeptide (TPR) repeat protein